MQKEWITILCEHLNESKKKQRKRNQGHFGEEGRSNMIFYLIHKSIFYPKVSFPTLSKGNAVFQVSVSVFADINLPGKFASPWPYPRVPNYYK